METTAAAVAVLPDDVLAAALGHLPARSLAASRCVSKSWRAIVDERRLLLRHVLPHQLRGLLVNYQDYERPHLFSRPTPADDVAVPRQGVNGGTFRFIPDRIYDWYEVVDHCNGLVLYRNTDSGVMYVCNPATRWWVRLPPPGLDAYWWHCCRVFLVFDPAVSPHYTVMVAPMKRHKSYNDDVACRKMEWPPLPWTWLEFSSRTGRWEEKAFVREGEAAGTVEGLTRISLGYSVEPRWRYAAYWQGSLYVHCHGEYVSRMSLLTDTYRVIKSPIELDECKNDDNKVRSFLGRSKDGVYFAAINDTGKLRVWTLSESTDQTAVWVPKHQSNLMTQSWRSWLGDQRCEGPWILDDPSNKNTNQDASAAEQNFCWNSDDDDIMDVVDEEDEGHFVKFLGFHPYKEVIFLCVMGHDVVACHLKSSKVQYLGTISPRTYNRGMRESFVYTPCLIIGDY